MASQKAGRSAADPAHRLRSIVGTLLWSAVILDTLGIIFFFGISIAFDDSASPPFNLVLAFAASASGPIILAAISSVCASKFVAKQRYRAALWSLAVPLIVLLGILAYLLVQFVLL